MIDHSAMKLGKQPAKFDARTLRMEKYMLPELPPPPYAVDGIGDTKNWGVMLNDSLGDCTIAACGHAVQVWTRTWGMVTPSDDAILKAYEQWDGYNPSDPSSDMGGIAQNVLNQWRVDGLAGHMISAYVSVQPRNPVHVQQAIALTGGIYIGLSLPLTAQKQAVWDVTDPTDKGNWGGHAVYIGGYDRAVNELTCITWGEPKRMTWNFFETYCDEAYAVLGADWKVTGLDVATLTANLQQVTG